MASKKIESGSAPRGRFANRVPKQNLATFFLSVTNQCNLACDYCSAGAGPQNHAMLDPADAEDLVRHWISGAIGDQLTLVFTGGEPLLWGYDSLARICRICRDEAAAGNKNLTIGIQSNGLLLDEDFISLCREYKIEPSFSLDGPPPINDIHRNGGEIVVASLKKLKAKKIAFGIVSCLTKELAVKIEPALEWFRKQGFLKVRINFLGQPPPERTATQLDPQLLFRVKKSIYDHLIKYGSTAVQERNVLRQVRKFDATFHGRLVEIEHCELLQCGAGCNLACLNPDGFFSLCVEKGMSNALGRVGSLAELAGARQEFWQGAGMWEMCQNCAADSICDHGCAAYHLMDHAKFESECQANRMFWKYLVLKRAPILVSERGEEYGR